MCPLAQSNEKKDNPNIATNTETSYIMYKKAVYCKLACVIRYTF